MHYSLYRSLLVSRTPIARHAHYPPSCAADAATAPAAPAGSPVEHDCEFFRLNPASRMRRFLNPTFFLFPFLVMILGAQTVPGWQLVWSDEFEGTALDTTKWEWEVNARGGGNNELQYYTDRPANTEVEDGVLALIARRERFTGPEGTREYTSARIRTKARGDWKYARIEIRAKMPVGQGIWPAIWMMPTDNVYGGWAASGEIDIMEYLGQKPHEVFGTLHYGAAWPKNVHTGQTFTAPNGRRFDEGFHVFALEWEEGEMRWYVDGEHYQTQTKWHTDSAPFPAPFDQRFHLIMNVAVGGNLPGAPDDQTTFPQAMLVDYVRVYQQAPAAE
jgi:beta-glucanase (GH16 family)